MQLCEASTGDAEAKEGGNGIDNELLLVGDAWREGKLPKQLEARLAEGKTLLHQLDPGSADREAQEAVRYGKIPEDMVCQVCVCFLCFQILPSIVVPPTQHMNTQASRAYCFPRLGHAV